MVMFLMMVTLVSPFVYEGGSIVVAQWQSMYGTHREPNTPVLNAVQDYTREVNEYLRRSTNRSVLAGNWNPSFAIPLAITWAGLGAFFLRRGK